MRQFLALELPPPWIDALRHEADALSRRLHGWRWLRIDAVHLTLKFLGEVDDSRDRNAREVWSRTVAGHRSFEIGLSGVGAFPPRGRPRVLWAGVRPSPPLDRLASDLEAAAAGLGFPAEVRAFRPHLTLARARRGERPQPPSEFPHGPVAPSFAVTEVTLMRSVLQPQGARYTALDRYRLACA